MKALVTGGAGFIGSHVVRDLLAHGHEVRVLHRPGENLVNLSGLGVECREGDVTDSSAMRAAVEGRDWVFHLAAIYALWTRQPERMREVNVGGTERVLEAARAAGVRRVVHTSSIAVFGGQGEGCDATEESPFRLADAGDLYSVTKYEAHRVALAFAARGLDVTLVAPTGPLGPGDIGPTPTGRILLSALHLPVALVPRAVSNVVDVRDVARGHVLAAERGRAGEAYLLGAENVALADIVRTTLATAGLRRPVLTVPSALLSAFARVLAGSARLSGRPPLLTAAGIEILRRGLRADCRKAFSELELPRTRLSVTIRDALMWFARHGYIKGASVRRGSWGRGSEGSRAVGRASVPTSRWVDHSDSEPPLLRGEGWGEVKVAEGHRREPTDVG